MGINIIGDTLLKNYNCNIFKDKGVLWNSFDKGTNPVLEGSVLMYNHVPKAPPRDLSSKIASLSSGRKKIKPKPNTFRHTEIKTITYFFAFKHTFKEILKQESLSHKSMEIQEIKRIRKCKYVDKFRCQLHVAILTQNTWRLNR